MLRTIVRTLILLAGIALAVGVTFSGRVSAIFQHEHSASQTTAAGTKRKVLYWYSSAGDGKDACGHGHDCARQAATDRRKD
jgi:hypothetical protein